MSRPRLERIGPGELHQVPVEKASVERAFEGDEDRRVVPAGVELTQRVNRATASPAPLPAPGGDPCQAAHRQRGRASKRSWERFQLGVEPCIPPPDTQAPSAVMPHSPGLGPLASMSTEK